MIQIFSVILLLIFLAAYLGRILLLRARGVHAFVLGKKGKISTSRERILCGATWIAGGIWVSELVFEPMIAALPVSAHGLKTLPIAGLAVTAAGITLFSAAMLAMKDSWRVGIDTTRRTALVEREVYAFSRNPAFTGVNMIFFGVFLAFPDLFTLAAFMMMAASMHSLILKEEEHWTAIGGKDYERYSKRVGRYLGVRR